MLVTLITTWLPSKSVAVAGGWPCRQPALSTRPRPRRHRHRHNNRDHTSQHAILLRNSSMGIDADSDACGV